jgi:hypothetical protein
VISKYQLDGTAFSDKTPKRLLQDKILRIANHLLQQTIETFMVFESGVPYTAKLQVLTHLV